MAVILFDDSAHYTLRPLTFTRPVANLRLGILTIAEKWGRCLETDYSYFTQPYLQAKFPVQLQEQNLLINGSVCPDEDLLEAIDRLRPGQALYHTDYLLAVKLNQTEAAAFTPDQMFDDRVEYQLPHTSIRCRRQMVWLTD